MLVSDPTGAAIPNAKVTLRNLETGVTREQMAASEGAFSFNLLQIGKYELKAEANGFRTSMAPAEVKAGEIANAVLKLEVGQVTETVTVSDAVAMLDTQNAQLQTSVTGAAIQDIPVNRNPNLFAMTAPGVAPVSSNNPFLGSGSFNSNGGRGRGNNITVDGITATDVSVTGTGGPLGPLNFSAIKEVKVITNNFSAEYGRNSSAQVMYITKNGTNSLRGEVYEYLQNDKLNARPFFDTTGKTNITKTNTYGFEVGGPVYIPKVLDGRNKLFWHAAYEGYKNRGVGATRIARVPTAGQVASVTDPTARAILQQYAVPTSPSGQITTAAPAKTDTYQWSVRGDANLGSRDTLWARYSIFDSVQNSTGLTFIDTNLPGFGASSKNRPRQATLAETHLVGASAVNEFRFGFGQSLPGFPIDTPYALGPRINFSDASVAGLGVSSILPQGREQRTYQFTDNFSLIRGSHNLKFGGEYYYLEADSYFDSSIRPVITFATFADFANGTPASFAQNFGDSVRANRVRNFFAFAQDDWKVTRNLTLNLGVRMEYAGGPTESNKLISNLNLDNRASYGAAGTGAFGLMETGKPSFNSNKNWGPRFGFAWTPRGSSKTVVRGGYGVAYDFVFLNPITNQRFLPPFIIAGSLQGAANFTGNDSFARIVAGTSATQAAFRSQIGTLSQTTLNFGNISPAIQQNLANPQVQQWNLGVQREILGGVVVKGSYVGTKGNFLPRTRPINLIGSQVPAATSVADEDARLAQFQTAFAGLAGTPTRRSNRIDGRYNVINYVESSANSIYHGAQFEVQKRFASYMFNANYTFAKAIDDNSDVLGVLVNDSSGQQDPRDNKNNRAVSQFDINQRLVISHHWEMPFFKDSPSSLVRGLLGGWAFAGISSFRSGFPTTLLAGPRRGITDTVLLGGTTATQRANASGSVNFKPVPAGSAGAPLGTAAQGPVAISTYATSLGLSQPLLGNIGNLGRGTHRLNGERNFDWNIYKNFRFWERAHFQVRAEFYNIFNNTSFQDVDRTITQPTFGQYTTVGQNARFMQVGARFVF
ncbi:MAG: TonB-dependent receptor [Acidobacteria bacterium]|nr:TonB-dependent receptor [Acidobacteriota bacterium]